MRIFFALLSLTFSLTSSAQSSANVQWFENLFSISKKRSVEDERKQADDRRTEALKIGDKRAEVKALIELGVIHLTRVSDYEQAMGWLIRSLAIEDSLQLNQEKVFTCLAMARVFEEVGYHNKGLEFLKQAQSVSESGEDKEIQTLILNETGRMNAAYGSLDEAFENYQLALEYAGQLKLPRQEGDAQFHLGQLWARKKKYTEALQTHKKALSIRRKLGDKANEANSLNEIGNLYSLMKNHERALANHVAALELRQAMKDDLGMAQSYNNIGGLYLDKKEFKRAISNLELALKAGREAQAQDEMKKSYDLLGQCYKELKDYARALEYKESLFAIQEFIQNERNERQLLEAQNQYVIGKKETEIDKLVLDKEQNEKVIEAQNKLRNILFLLIVLAIVIGVLILYMYIQKRRSNLKLQELNATKDKLFSIIGHDLRGPLNSLSSFSSLLLNHTDSLTKDEIRMLSKDLDKSLKNLFTLLENLLEWSRSQTGNVDFKKEEFDITRLLKENEELLKGLAESKKIALVNESAQPLMANAHRHSINTVVRNLLSNAIKFTPQNGEIRFKVEHIGKELVVTVADNGVGMSESAMQKLFKLGTKHSTLGTAQEKGTGLGLILCKDFVEKNGGSIHVESKEGKGSRFYFTVPALN